MFFSFSNRNCFIQNAEIAFLPWNRKCENHTSHGDKTVSIKAAAIIFTFLIKLFQFDCNFLFTENYLLILYHELWTEFRVLQFLIPFNECKMAEIFSALNDIIWSLETPLYLLVVTCYISDNRSTSCGCFDMHSLMSLLYQMMGANINIISKLLCAKI